MPKLINMVGKKFGKLTVIERDLNPPKYEKARACWLCKCDCGNPKLKSVSGTNLRTGKIISCAQCDKYEMIGKTFGRLTVLELDEEYKKLHSIKTKGINYFKCRCSCPAHNIVSVSGKELRNGGTASCGCLRSHGEEAISAILKNNNIQFETQKSFSDLLSERGKQLKYDFYLPEYNCIIEFDGEQHFKFQANGWNTLEHFQDTRKHDKLKNQYCFKNNLYLIRIPYAYINLMKIEDLIPTTSNFILTPESEKDYYEKFN